MGVNLPKFLAQDIPLFQGIISDLFPGITLPKSEYSDLLCAVDEVCQRRNLQNVKFFTEKIIQMYEMMLVRHGLVDGFFFTSVLPTIKITHLNNLDVLEFLRTRKRQFGC